MKKLLQINPVVRTSTSTGKIMRTLGELAMSAGWESWIAYSRARDGVPAHSSNLLPVGNKWDLAFHWIATRIFDAHGLASRRATKKLIAQIRTIDPDIVHIHNVHGYFLNYPLLCDFLSERGKPVIWTVHDCWLFTGHCSHFTFAGCDKWKTHCENCPQKHCYPASFFLDRSKENFDRKKQAFLGVKNMTLITPSKWLADLVKQSFLKGYPVEVRYNTIDTNVFKPTPSDFREKYNSQNKKIVLGVANPWTERKGFYDFLWLAEKLDNSYQIVLVGLTQKQLDTLPKNIIGIKRTNSPKELAEIYTAADVFVNPTYEDNYPTTNLEAQACGTPTITYRTGGSPESVPEENVVEYGNKELLFEKIRSVLKKK